MASQFIFDAIGTHWQIDIADLLSPEKESELLKNVQERIALFDKAYSRFRADSLVTEMSKKRGEYIFPEDGELLISTYKKFYDITGGLVTPLIGQALVDAGYDAEYSLTQKRPLEKPKHWEEVLNYIHPKMFLKESALLDFGAAGKGYLVDIVAAVIEKAGCTSYCVDAGGDILHRSIKNDSLKIGLENPNDFSQAIGIVNISNKSLCASAGSRRKWGEFHHIINPETLHSPHDVIATWVTADSTILADAIATSLFFVAPEAVLKHYSYEYVVLYSDYSAKKSDSFPGDLFTS